MKLGQRNWRNVAEAIGVVSVVAELLLVAWEIRQANNIARAQTVIELAAQYNQFNSSRFENPDVANLSLSLAAKDGSAISETEKSMMAGASWHFANIMWSAQVAFDNGLLGQDDIDKYRSDLEWMLEYMPGLRTEFIAMYETMPSVQNSYVFEPISSFAKKTVDPDEN